MPLEGNIIGAHEGDAAATVLWTAVQDTAESSAVRDDSVDDVDGVAATDESSTVAGELVPATEAVTATDEAVTATDEAVTVTDEAVTVTDDNEHNGLGILDSGIPGTATELPRLLDAGPESTFDADPQAPPQGETVDSVTLEPVVTEEPPPPPPPPLLECDAGASCEAPPTAIAELCNGLDDDGNGIADDVVEPGFSEEVGIGDKFTNFARMKTTRAGDSTVCFVSLDGLECAGVDEPLAVAGEPLPSTLVMTGVDEIVNFDFTFDAEGYPLFCLIRQNSAFVYRAELLGRDAATGDYVPQQLGQDASSCDISWDDAGTVRVVQSFLNGEPVLYEIAACDLGVSCVANDDTLEWQPEPFPNPTLQADPSWDIVPVVQVNDDGLTLRMISNQLLVALAAPSSEEYRLYGPSLVIRADGRRLVSYNQDFNSSHLMCGSECFKQEVDLLRLPPFEDLVDERLTSQWTKVSAGYAIPGGFMIKSDGVVRLVYIRDGKLFQVFVCG